MLHMIYRRSLLVMILLFSIFLVVGNVYIYNQQRNSLISAFSASQQTELQLLSQLAKESFISENYSLIEWFFNRWGKERSDVVSLMVQTEKGFFLNSYQRPKAAVNETITHSINIIINQNTYKITLTSELTEIEQQLGLLLLQLIIVSSIATLWLGATIWYLFQKFTIRPLVKEVERRQIAEQKIQQQHQFLQAVIDGVKDGIMVINSDYEVELFNKAAENSMVVSAPIGKGCVHCYEVSHQRNAPCDGKDHPCPLHEVFKTEKHAFALHNHPDKDGNNRYYELLASPLVDSEGKVTRIIETSRELTSHIRLQNQLESASEAKSSLLANMSHEIRSPMNGILSMAEVLSNTNMSETQQEYVHHILDSGHILMNLLNDVLDFSKIEAGRLEIKPAPFVFNELVEAIVFLMQPQAESKGVIIKAEVDPHLPILLLGDFGCIRQVLINLVDNAVKFTEQGSIFLRVQCLNRYEEMVKCRISIQDTGIGIDEAEIPHLFERYRQVDDGVSRERTGTGLGLAICRKLIEMMGGKIGVESSSGVGTCFWFEIELEVSENILENV